MNQLDLFAAVAGNPLHAETIMQSFDTFLAAASNDVAFNAARAFAALDPRLNPLFIHGGHGRGKTHLLRAIQAAAGEARAACRYLSAEAFTVGLAAAWRQGSYVEFRQSFGEARFLLIDDLQTMADREQHQSALFHLLNFALIDGRRVAVVADRPPSDLDGFEPRLRSWLGGGMVVDVGPPERQLSEAFIRRALLGADVEPDHDLVVFLARRLGSNLRDVQGAITRLVTYGQVKRRRLDVEFALEILTDLIRAHRHLVTIDEIQTRVSDHFRIRKAEMTSARRAREVARPRQVAMYLSKQLTPRSLPEIGRRFGGRDHTTVIHAVRQIEKLRAQNPELDHDVRQLERTLAQ
jgi:chromosomal replication initiator protein